MILIVLMICILLLITIKQLNRGDRQGDRQIFYFSNGNPIYSKKE